MLSLFQMFSVPNQHPALKVLCLTQLLARQSAVNYSPRAQPSGGTHISPYRFFETFLLGHCYFIVFMDMKSVFTEGSFVLQSCTDIDLYFVRLLYNMISEGILQFTMSVASWFSQSELQDLHKLFFYHCGLPTTANICGYTRALFLLATLKNK